MHQSRGGHLLPVLQIHAEECAALGELRVPMVSSPAASLLTLARMDRRLAAHFDALGTAGGPGWKCCEALLERPEPGSLFAAAVRAVEGRSRPHVLRAMAAAEDTAHARTGLIQALMWVEPPLARSMAGRLITSAVSWHRQAGLQIGLGLIGVSPDGDSRVAADGASGPGETEWRRAIRASIDDRDDACRFEAVYAAILLGDRANAVDALLQFVTVEPAGRWPALRLALQVLDTPAGHSLLRRLNADAHLRPVIIRGSGVIGDPAYVPWLIESMRDPQYARGAGEAFSLVTGADLDRQGLWRERPEGFESGPTDDPDDADVAVDPDESLSWPDATKVEQWWAANASRFEKGKRYFMGQPVTREHCIDVLEHGYQHQRILAAHYLCLLTPGTPLFNTSAPAWRQQRLLAQMK